MRQRHTNKRVAMMILPVVSLYMMFMILYRINLYTLLDDIFQLFIPLPQIKAHHSSHWGWHISCNSQSAHSLSSLSLSLMCRPIGDISISAQHLAGLSELTQKSLITVWDNSQRMSPSLKSHVLISFGPELSLKAKIEFYFILWIEKCPKHSRWALAFVKMNLLKKNVKY